jgi:hypothetical protein
MRSVEHPKEEEETKDLLTTNFARSTFVQHLVSSTCHRHTSCQLPCFKKKVNTGETARFIFSTTLK